MSRLVPGYSGYGGIGHQVLLVLAFSVILYSNVFALDFNVIRISDPLTSSRDPVISATGLAAWTYFNTNQMSSAYSHIAIYNAADASVDTTSLLLFIGATKLYLQSNNMVFVSGYLDTRQKRLRRPEPRASTPTNEATSAVTDKRDLDISNSIQYNISELSENKDDDSKASGDLTTVWLWRHGEQSIQRMPAQKLNNVSPAHWGELTTWQWEQEWPFGYEIMYTRGGDIIQLTTNKFYDLGPQVHGDKIVWFGWDGYDYEIFMFDAARNETIQITSNRFDDTAPYIWNDVIVWEGYPGVEADVFMWRDGTTTKISDNLDDDLYPRIWDKYVVWQGFDGDDFEIYLYDIEKGGSPLKVTSNNFDDTNPQIHDDLITWMGFHDNWDSEVYHADLRGVGIPGGIEVRRMTENEIDDRDVRTAGRRIIWVAEERNLPQIMFAQPR